MSKFTTEDIEGKNENEDMKVGHGVGSTKTYYDKWNEVAADELRKTEEEEQKEESITRAALGNDAPMSEAEAQAREKHEELVQARQQWIERQDREKKLMLTIDGNNNFQTFEIDSDVLGEHRVITIKNCKNSSYFIPQSVQGLIKIFVEDCFSVNIDVKCSLITKTLEIVHCENCCVNIYSQIHTVQADLCQNMDIRYMGDAKMEPVNVNQSISAKNPQTGSTPSKVYWAGCHGLSVHTNGLVCAPADYTELTESTGGLLGSSSYEEVQFVIHVVEDDLLNERVIRTKDNLPSTAREMGLPCDGSADIQDAQRRALEQSTLGAKEKGGNHFKAGEFAQAAVEYTRALESGKLHNYDGMHILHANRAFCFSKLGQHEKALEDAEEATLINPKYTKGWFRKGIALHALKRYREACPALGEALRLEPKNESVKDALRFAEMRAMQEGAGR